MIVPNAAPSWKNDGRSRDGSTGVPVGGSDRGGGDSDDDSPTAAPPTAASSADTRLVPWAAGFAFGAALGAGAGGADGAAAAPPGASGDWVGCGAARVGMPGVGDGRGVVVGGAAVGCGVVGDATPDVDDGCRVALGADVVLRCAAVSGAGVPGLGDGWATLPDTDVSGLDEGPAGGEVVLGCGVSPDVEAAGFGAGRDMTPGVGVAPG